MENSSKSTNAEFLQNQYLNLKKIHERHDFFFSFTYSYQTSATIVLKEKYSKKLVLSPLSKKKQHLKVIVVRNIHERKKLPYIPTIWTVSKLASFQQRNSHSIRHRLAAGGPLVPYQMSPASESWEGRGDLTSERWEISWRVRDERGEKSWRLRGERGEKTWRVTDERGGKSWQVLGERG